MVTPVEELVKPLNFQPALVLRDFASSNSTIETLIESTFLSSEVNDRMFTFRAKKAPRLDILRHVGRTHCCSVICSHTHRGYKAVSQHRALCTSYYSVLYSYIQSSNTMFSVLRGMTDATGSPFLVTLRFAQKCPLSAFWHILELSAIYRLSQSLSPMHGKGPVEEDADDIVLGVCICFKRLVSQLSR